jgi:hypothetical protein
MPGKGEEIGMQLTHRLWESIDDPGAGRSRIEMIIQMIPTPTSKKDESVSVFRRRGYTSRYS